MKKTFLYIMMCALALAACRKGPREFDIEASAKRQSALEEDLRKMLSDPNGWMLYIPYIKDTVVKTAVPFHLKFDMEKELCSYNTIYPVQEGRPQPAYFQIGSSTGAPLLTFSTASIFTRMYYDGLVQDYFFRLNKVSDDTVMATPYRSGGIYAKEGGTPMYMIRQKSDPSAMFNRSRGVLVDTFIKKFFIPPSSVNFGELRSEYLPTGNKDTLSFSAIKHTAGNEAFFWASVPMTSYYQAFPLRMFSRTVSEQSTLYIGANAIIWNTQANYTPADWFTNLPQAYMRRMRTSYFLIKDIAPGTGNMALYALDAQGKEIVTGLLKMP